MIIDAVYYHLLPDSRQELAHYDVADELAEQYHTLTEAGCTISVEKLRLGVMSICVEHRSIGFSYDSRITALNGPGIINAIEGMIREFDLARFLSMALEHAG